MSIIAVAAGLLSGIPYIGKFLTNKYVLIGIAFAAVLGLATWQYNSHVDALLENRLTEITLKFEQERTRILAENQLKLSEDYKLQLHIAKQHQIELDRIANEYAATQVQLANKTRKIESLETQLINATPEQVVVIEKAASDLLNLELSNSYGCLEKVSRGESCAK